MTLSWNHQHIYQLSKSIKPRQKLVKAKPIYNFFPASGNAGRGF